MRGLDGNSPGFVTFLAGKVKAVVNLGLDMWRTPSGFVAFGGTIEVCRGSESDSDGLRGAFMYRRN